MTNGNYDLSNDPTIQTILTTVIEMNGKLSSVISNQDAHKDHPKRITALENKQAEAQAEAANDRKWHYRIAAVIGACSAFILEHFPSIISKAVASIFHNG